MIHTHETTGVIQASVIVKKTTGGPFISNHGVSRSTRTPSNELLDVGQDEVCSEMKNNMLEVQIKMKQELNKRYAKDLKIRVLQPFLQTFAQHNKT